MKRRMLTTLFLVACASMLARAEGRILFMNRSGTSVNWPVDRFFGGPVSGPDYVAQLFAGVSSNSLTPIGPPVPFRSVVGTGYLDFSKDPAGGVRIVPTVENVPGGTTLVKVIAWSAWCGCPTYESALKRRACGGYVEVGESLVVEMDTGAPDNSEPPALMSRMQPFTIWGPLSGPWDEFFVLPRTNAVLRVLYQANVGNMRGTHILEWSTNMVDWQNSVTYSTEYSLELILTNDLPVKFYRMRRACD